MITVLITTYNSAEFLNSSIKSILKQTFKNFELLIIDDGSEDETEKIVKSYFDKRIKYIKIPHSGRAKALNFGLQKAKYDWIALMDADDIAHPKRLEKQLINGLKRNSVVIASSVYFLDKRLLFKIDVKKLKFPDDLILHQKFPNAVLYNKFFILENGGYNKNLAVAEDYDLWLRIMHKTDFIIVDDVLMFYRFTAHSLSRKNKKKTENTIYQIQSKYYYNLKINFNVANKFEESFFLGWREFFFGNPSKARYYWLMSGIKIFNPRIILAFIITFLPNGFRQNFKQSGIKLRLYYFINSLFGKNKIIKSEFHRILNIIGNLGNENL